MNEPWERDVIEKTLLAAVTEQRRARRWAIFFRLTWLAVILLVALPLFASWFGNSNDSLPAGGRPHAAVIDINGVINNENDSARKISDGLKNAYKDPNTRGIIMRANSPGGSPVLSGMAYDEIRRQKTLHPDIPVLVAVEEVCASGCYYIASAADKIFANQASIVGSIGVLSEGFGFTGAMEKLGIERRLATSGRDKGMGDPFSPQTPAQVSMRQELLDTIPGQFITAVRQGRGKRLKTGEDLFTGRVWVGSQAVPLGLIDGLSNVDAIAREQLDTDNVVDFTPKDSFSSRLGKRLGMQIADGVRDGLSMRWW